MLTPLLLLALLPASPALACTCYRTSTSALYTHGLRLPFPSSYPNASFWTAQAWGKRRSKISPVAFTNSLSNVRTTSDSLILTTERTSATNQTGAELEVAADKMLYASVRARMKVSGASGGVAGIFFYANDHNESDIEILTRDDRSIVRYSNQPVVDEDGNEIPDASTIINLATDSKVDATDSPDERRRKRDVESWDQWHTHRLDWLPARTVWLVDGEQLLEKTYGVPTVESTLTLNMWSDGGTWSRNMSVGEQAQMELKWVEVFYNTTDDDPDPCSADDAEICEIDDGGNDEISEGSLSSAASSFSPVTSLMSVVIACSLLLIGY